MLRGPDIHELALAQGQAGLVVEAHQAQHAGVVEALIGEAVQRQAAEREEGVTGVDGLGHTGDHPQRRPVTPLRAVVLDVVVHEAEVVAHLHGRSTGQRADMVTGDGVVGEQTDEWPDALAPGCIAVEAEVVAHHGVQLARALVLGPGDDAEDGGLGIGDESVQVDARQHANMILVVSTSSMTAMRRDPAGAPGTLRSVRQAPSAGQPPRIGSRLCHDLAATRPAPSCWPTWTWAKPTASSRC